MMIEVQKNVSLADIFLKDFVEEKRIYICNQRKADYEPCQNSVADSIYCIEGKETTADD